MIGIIIWLFWAFIICWGIYLGFFLIAALVGTVVSPFLPDSKPNFDDIEFDDDDDGRWDY